MLRILIFVVIIFISISCDNSISPIVSTESDLCYEKLDGNSNWQIFTDNRFGTNSQNISNNPVRDTYSPLWRPDGKYIAFRYDRENTGGCDTYLYDMENKEKINITAEFVSTQSATPKLWSPDGTRLLYYYHKLGETYYYCIMNSDGTDKKQLFESESVKIISFCDQGNSILYTREQMLCKTDVNTASTEIILDFTTISNNSLYVDGYNPNSNIILCHEDSTSWNGGGTFLIKKINLTTMEGEILATAEDDFRILFPVFSNDYSKVAYIARDYENNISKIILIENGEKIELNKLTNENESYGFYKMKFSPKDKYILYTVFQNEGAWFRSYTYILNTYTKEKNLISEGHNPQWNPLNNY